MIVAIHHPIAFALQRPLGVIDTAERASPSSSLVFANRLSRPVGRSGGKNRWGRSQAPLSSTALWTLTGDGLVGVQSIALSSRISSILIGEAWEVVEAGIGGVNEE